MNNQKDFGLVGVLIITLIIGVGVAGATFHSIQEDGGVGAFITKLSDGLFAAVLGRDAGKSSEVRSIIADRIAELNDIVATKAKTVGKGGRAGAVATESLQEVLRERNQLLHDLKDSNPSAFLSAMLSEDVRSDIPKGLRKFVEEPFIETGILITGVKDMFEANISLPIYVLFQEGKTSVSLYPTTDIRSFHGEKINVEGFILNDHVVFNSLKLAPNTIESDPAPQQIATPIAGLRELITGTNYPGIAPSHIVPGLSSGYKWGTNDITYTFLTSLPSYYSATSQEASDFTPFNEAQKVAIREILQEITNSSDLTFTEVNSNSMMTFAGTELGGGTVGWAYYPYHTGSGSQSGDVWIDNDWFGTERYSFRRMALVHETGHAIGLQHPSFGGYENTRQYTVESYAKPAGTSGRDPATFMPYDWVAIQNLYGADHSGDGDRVHDVDMTNYLVQVESIWDQDGFDTITARTSTSNNILSTTNGAFLSAGPAAMNIGVPYGACYESVVGGLLNDHISGNIGSASGTGCAADQTLTGGGDQDVFHFGPSWGDDIITDFQSGIDLLDVTLAGLVPADLLPATQNGSHAVLSNGGNTITLQNVEASGITAIDFTLDGDFVPIDPDVEAPVVTIISPINGSVYITVTEVGVSASATDDKGTVSSINYFMNGAPMQGTVLKTGDVLDGLYMFRAEATDPTGNISSDEVSITVDLPDDTAPVVNESIVINVFTDSAQLQISTDTNVSSFVEYGTNTLFGQVQNLDQGNFFQPILSGLSSDTTYFARAVVTNIRGNTTFGTTFAFTTLPQPADSTPPAVDITAPTNGATVLGTVTVSAEAFDNVGVTRVEFYINGTIVSTSLDSPHIYGWDTTAYSDGSASLFARAYDAAGNTAQSNTVGVTIENATSEPPGDTTPPTINDIVFTDMSTATDTQWQITWRTNEPATGILRHGNKADNLNQTVDLTNLDSVHTVLLIGLKANSNHYVEVTATDEVGNTTTSLVERFRTAKLSGGGGDGGSTGKPQKCTPWPSCRN